MTIYLIIQTFFPHNSEFTSCNSDFYSVYFSYFWFIYFFMQVYILQLWVHIYSLYPYSFLRIVSLYLAIPTCFFRIEFISHNKFFLRIVFISQFWPFFLRIESLYILILSLYYVILSLYLTLLSLYLLTLASFSKNSKLWLKKVRIVK